MKLESLQAFETQDQHQEAGTNMNGQLSMKNKNFSQNQWQTTSKYSCCVNGLTNKYSNHDGDGEK